MKRTSRRPEQLAHTIRQVLADVLDRELRDPRVGLVTITRIEVSSDLSHARIFVAPSGNAEQKEQALSGLTSAAGFLRTRLAQAATTRNVPELHFKMDRGLEHARRIDQLLSGSAEVEEDDL